MAYIVPLAGAGEILVFGDNEKERSVSGGRNNASLLLGAACGRGAEAPEGRTCQGKQARDPITAAKTKSSGLFVIFLRPPGPGFFRNLRGSDTFSGRAIIPLRCFIERKECKMNWNQVEGNWEQFKGSVQKNWGKLTGDDLDVIKGNRKQLAGKLQERYGTAQEEAERDIDTWLRRH
jgi:uncharacterized protein YjbJ (UPF0337 family)